MDTRIDRGASWRPASPLRARTTTTSVNATIRPDHLAAAADACAAGFARFSGPRGVSAGAAVRRYGVVKVLLSDGVQRQCLTVRMPGLHRRRVFIPEGLHIAELFAELRYVPAGEKQRADLAHDLPELARRLLPVMHLEPTLGDHSSALVQALRDQLPAVEAAVLAGQPTPTPWSVPAGLIPLQEDSLHEAPLQAAGR